VWQRKSAKLGNANPALKPYTTPTALAVHIHHVPLRVFVVPTDEQIHGPRLAIEGIVSTQRTIHVHVESLWEARKSTNGEKFENTQGLTARKGTKDIEYQDESGCTRQEPLQSYTSIVMASEPNPRGLDVLRNSDLKDDHRRTCARPIVITW